MLLHVFVKLYCYQLCFALFMFSNSQLFVMYLYYFIYIQLHLLLCLVRT